MSGFNGDFFQNAPQRCIFLLDTTSRMRGGPIKALNDGLVYFHDQIQQAPELGSSLEIAIVTYGQQGSIVQWPQMAATCPPPYLTAKGNASVQQGLLAATSLLDHHEGQTMPWLVSICGANTPDTPRLEDQLINLEWSLKLANMPTLTVCLDETQPGYLPPQEHPFQLRELRFQAFFDWLIEAMDFRIQCQDDLPYTTAYSWAYLNSMPHSNGGSRCF